MQQLLETILTVLRGEDQLEIYPSFDAVPVSRKSTAMFTVAAPVSIRIEPAFPGGVGTAVRGVFPFTAVYQISVLIPMTQPLQTAEDFFYSVIVPRMESVGSTLCEVLPAHADAALGRVVMQGKFQLGGIFLEGSETV